MQIQSFHKNMVDKYLIFLLWIFIDFLKPNSAASLFRDGMLSTETRNGLNYGELPLNYFDFLFCIVNNQYFACGIHSKSLLNPIPRNLRFCSVFHAMVHSLERG